MKSYIILLLSVFAAAWCQAHTEPETATKPGLSYLKAKQKAETQNLKYILYFKADWCAPCQWMEETTFSDETIESAVDNLFLLVPLDIDAFEGYALKEYFRVYTLPTLLVFNEKHEIVNRSEGSLSASALLKLVAEEKEFSQKPLANADFVNTGPVIKTAETAPVREVTESHQVNTGLSNEIMESVTRFGVQLGAFSAWNNAQLTQQKAQQYTTEPIEIMTIPKGDKTIYKVFAGKLNSETEAQQLKRTLDTYGLEGFVKPIVLSVKS